jgi:hypothetical protein
MSLPEILSVRTYPRACSRESLLVSLPKKVCPRDPAWEHIRESLPESISEKARLKIWP